MDAQVVANSAWKRETDLSGNGSVSAAERGRQECRLGPSVLAQKKVVAQGERERRENERKDKEKKSREIGGV